MRRVARWMAALLIPVAARWPCRPLLSAMRRFNKVQLNVEELHMLSLEISRRAGSWFLAWVMTVDFGTL
jgi:hypothetical protein